MIAANEMRSVRAGETMVHREGREFNLKERHRQAGLVPCSWWRSAKRDAEPSQIASSGESMSRRSNSMRSMSGPLLLGHPTMPGWDLITFTPGSPTSGAGEVTGRLDAALFAAEPKLVNPRP